MKAVRWDPFRDLNILQDRMNRLFDDAGRGWRSDEPAATTTWSPAVDIFETEGEIVVKAELPGVDRKDISLHLENNVLTLKGNGGSRRKQKRKTTTESSVPTVASVGLFPFQPSWMKKRSVRTTTTAYSKSHFQRRNRQNPNRSKSVTDLETDIAVVDDRRH